MDLIKGFDMFHIEHVHQEQNKAANEIAQQASWYEVTRGEFLVKYKPTLCCIEGACTEGHESVETPGKYSLAPRDWRYNIRECIKSHGSIKDRKVRHQALQYTMVGDELYRRIMDGTLLKCLGEEQAKVAMCEVHEGMCGTHQSAHKMR
jgi:hypothetical protein